MIHLIAGILKRSDVSRETALGIVFRPDEKTLLLLRRNRPKVWAPPGGHIEKGETAEKAAVRETYEETRIKTRLLGKIDANLGPQIQTFVLAAPQKSSVLLTGEHSAFYWFELDQLPPRKGVSPDLQVFKKALEIYRRKK